MFPDCFILPWKRPSCDRLKGWDMMGSVESRGKDGNIVITLRTRCDVAQPLMHWQDSVNLKRARDILREFPSSANYAS